MINYFEQFGAIGAIADIGSGVGRNIDNVLKNLDLGKNLDNLGKGLDDIGKNLDLGKNFDNIGKNLDVGKNLDNVGKNLDDIGKNLDVGKNLDNVGKDLDVGNSAVTDAIKNSPDALVSNAKGVLAQAGDGVVDFAKNHPMLVGAGLTAGGVAIYAAANNMSFNQAIQQLTKAVGTDVIRPIAESTATLAGSVVGVAANDLAAPLLAPFWEAIKKIFETFKLPLLIIGAILVLLILYKISRFAQN